VGVSLLPDQRPPVSYNGPPYPAPRNAAPYPY